MYVGTSLQSLLTLNMYTCTCKLSQMHMYLSYESRGPLFYFSNSIIIFKQKAAQVRNEEFVLWKESYTTHSVMAYTYILYMCVGTFYVVGSWDTKVQMPR